MHIYKQYLLVFKCSLFIFMFIGSYYLYHNRIVVMVVLLFLTTTLMINDYIRSIKLSINSGHMYNASLLFTIFGVSVLAYFIKEFGPNVYIVFSLAELLKLKGKRQKILFLVHSFLYTILILIDIGIPINWDKLLSSGVIVMSYFGIAITVYTFKTVRTKKEEINKLNEKLQLANIKLHQYTLEVEALTVSKERTIMAQELHDSVGHSLMALSMHLEFAEKMYDTDPNKVKEILIKSRDIAKSSIISLRESVNLLKEGREIESFNHSIESIINNFHLLNDLKINFNAVENMDNLSLIIKNSMYNTIKESITNSIKHGNATEINIIISMKNNSINLILTDNGIGCNKIVKSNGLLGIENRVTSLNGSVNYFNNDSFGFGIDICIPILMEVI